MRQYLDEAHCCCGVQMLRQGMKHPSSVAEKTRSKNIPFLTPFSGLHQLCQRVLLDSPLPRHWRQANLRDLPEAQGISRIVPVRAQVRLRTVYRKGGLRSNEDGERETSPLPRLLVRERRTFTRMHFIVRARTPGFRESSLCPSRMCIFAAMFVSPNFRIT